MSRFSQILVLFFCFSIVCSVSHAGILGDFQPGVRAGYYDDNESFFLGVDLKLSALIVNANPNIEYVFVDNASLWAFNLDGFISVFSVPLVSLWVGGGVGFLYFNPDEGNSDTDPSINLIAGAELGVPLSPYLMGKFIITDKHDGFVVGVGVRF